MTTAWLFPGQGAESPRMGLGILSVSPPAGRRPQKRPGSEAARRLLDHAARVLDVDVERLLARGGRTLERTEILQPVMTAVSLGAREALRAAGCAPDLVAGHSLGEIAAWATAGALTPVDAISLAAERGRLMAEAATATPGGLVALCGCEEAAVEAALERGRGRGMVALAARNAPDEWVLSGDERALSAVSGTRLRVAGPWHSPAMQRAATRLRDYARDLPRRALDTPLVLGATGQLTSESADLPELVAESLVRPVQWTAVMATLRARGVRAVVTCGPGKVLASLCRRNLGPDVRTLGTETADHLGRTLTELSHET